MRIQLGNASAPALLQGSSASANLNWQARKKIIHHIREDYFDNANKLI